MFTLGGVHISEVFSYCKRYEWNWDIVFTSQRYFHNLKDTNPTVIFLSH